VQYCWSSDFVEGSLDWNYVQAIRKNYNDGCNNSIVFTGGNKEN
jgi:hypothetical protein